MQGGASHDANTARAGGPPRRLAVI